MHRWSANLQCPVLPLATSVHVIAGVAFVWQACSDWLSKYLCVIATTWHAKNLRMGDTRQVWSAYSCGSVAREGCSTGNVAAQVIGSYRRACGTREAVLLHRRGWRQRTQRDETSRRSSEQPVWVLRAEVSTQLTLIGFGGMCHCVLIVHMPTRSTVLHFGAVVWLRALMCKS